MSRLMRALATGAVACVALTGFAAGPAAAAGVNPAMNQPSSWGTSCVKVEYTKATRTLWIKANTRVIIKAGTVYHQFAAKTYGRTVTVPKDISFVISCPTTPTPPPPPVDPYYPPIEPYYP